MMGCAARETDEDVNVHYMYLGVMEVVIDGSTLLQRWEEAMADVQAEGLDDLQRQEEPPSHTVH